MMSRMVKFFIGKQEEICTPEEKQAYATLSSMAGIILNLFLGVAKIVSGYFSRSVAISADSVNNLSDAGISLVSLLGFQIAKYGRGKIHPFGHGRFEWIMGIFTSIAVFFMGCKLMETSIHSVVNPKQPIFHITTVIILILSILVKAYMYLYNKQFARLTDSETLKATAADCISDAAATGAVLFSTILSRITGWSVDGYCGSLVSIFIIVTGIKSLWEVLGRIMGKAADQEIMDTVMQSINSHPEIIGVQNLMLHDYGFGCFILSMQVDGYKKDSEQLYASIQDISYYLYQKYRCDCFIQIDYLIKDAALTKKLEKTIHRILRQYPDEISMDQFRLIENGPSLKITFDLYYPPELQKTVEQICKTIEAELKASDPNYRTIIKSIIRDNQYKNKPAKSNI